MSGDHRQPCAGSSRGVSGRAWLTVSALVFALLTGSAIAAGATAGDAAEAGRLRSALTQMTKLVNHGMRPPALRLNRDLPGDAGRLERLREPASTTQAQVKIALDELRQMNSFATLDPHYLPALVAAGRAYVAVSGQDPVTGTTVNPDYLGIEPELVANAARLDGSAGDAGKLSGRVKRLARQLIRSKRRAHRLERQLRRMRSGGAAAR